MADTILSARQCASVLRAIGDGTRLRILELLLVQDKCVTDLVRELRRPQPHISHHLRILRDAGLVEGLREGKRICYRIAPHVHRALRDHQGKALDFGCCQVTFPQTVLSAQTQ
jgi:ArsR family transcriptional regulator